MDYVSLVRSSAKKLDLLDAEGGLKRLDSIEIVDLVVEIERLGAFDIPTAAVSEAAFASVEAIAAMLVQIAPAPPTGAAR